MTDIEPISVLTLGPILAGSPVAHVHPGLAVVASEAVPTPAGVVVDAVKTNSTIHARCGCTIIVILLTVSTRKSTWTCAGVGVDIIFADGSILAGVGETFIDVILTIFALKSWHTDALVITDLIQTGSSIDTWISSTIVSIQKTISALVSKRTLTCVASIGVDTCSSISAGSGGGTFINVNLTSGSLIAKRTGAGELSVVTIR